MSVGVGHQWVGFVIIGISDKTQPIFDITQIYLLWPHMWQIPPINDKLHFVIFVMLTPYEFLNWEIEHCDWLKRGHMIKIKVSHWHRRFVVISLPAKKYWGLSPMGGICHYWDTPHKWQNLTHIWQNPNVSSLTPYVTNPAHKWQTHLWRFRNGYIDMYIYIYPLRRRQRWVCHIWAGFVTYGGWSP